LEATAVPELFKGGRDEIHPKKNRLEMCVRIGIIGFIVFCRVSVALQALQIRPLLLVLSLSRCKLGL